MELQVEIVSWETIKPVTPTPTHLKRHKLSLLDQLAPLIYGLKINCYANNKNGQKDDAAHTIARLKHSLSRALSVFYPIAGRLTEDESAIDCNDAGILFVEARCDFPLSHFLHAPNRIDMAWRFLPSIIPPLETSSCKSRSLLVTEIVPFAVQVSIFSCGGVIIGRKQLTKIFDGASTGIFLKVWSDYYFADGVDNTMAVNVINKPDFTLASTLFPPHTWASVTPPRPPVLVSALDGIQEGGPCIVKVFEFSPHSLSSLRAMARSDHVPNPTRVEAVTGFIWKHAMIAAAASAHALSPFPRNAHISGPSLVTHAVNMRSRIRPKLSPKAFGNMVIHAIAYYKGQDNHYNEASTPELAELVANVSRALAEVKDPKFLSKLQGVEGGEVIRQYKQKLVGLMDTASNSYRFASWSWISGLDSEFGLGSLVWAGVCGGRMNSSFKNLIVLIEKPNHGIHASIILDKQEMLCLQSSPDFLAFTSQVDKPLNLCKM